MLGTSPSGADLVSHSTHWLTLWFLHPSSIELIHSYSPSHSKLTTALLEFTPMPGSDSSTGTTTDVTTATDLSGSHTPWMFPVIPCFEGTPIKLIGGIFTTGTGLYASMFYFANITTGWCYAPSITISECADKKKYVDALSTSLLLHNSMALLYPNSMSNYNIILAGRHHNTNWYCNSSSCHLCTTWGTLASDSKNFQSTEIWQYPELWSAQVIYELSYVPPYCSCLSYKAISWLFQWQQCWSQDERNWS